MLLIIANLIFFMAGIFLDLTSATLLPVPIIAPMGLSLSLVSDIAKVTIRQILCALLPFCIPLLTTLAILTFAKDFTLWLPRMIAP